MRKPRGKPVVKPETPFWTDERVAVLVRFAKERKTSMDVAVELGCTRNAVCGKATKLRVRFASHFWSVAAVETLTKMAAGGSNAAEIAEALGTTRGPVYDKAARMKIKIKRDRTGPPPSSPRARLFLFDAGALGQMPPQHISTTGPTPASLNIRMWDERFTAKCCSWATSEDVGGYFFCAAQKLPGLPYCLPHARMAYRPAPPRPPSAVKDTAQRDERPRDADPAPLNFGRAA